MVHDEMADGLYLDIPCSLLLSVIQKREQKICMKNMSVNFIEDFFDRD